jgi:uncharacterized protein (DUF433 family)
MIGLGCLSVFTMTLKELEPQLLALSDAEKNQVVRWLRPQSSIVSQGIERTAEVCGGSACIVGTRITVWGLVEARRSGYSEADLLISYRSITAIDLMNAWQYAANHLEEIETEIQENDDVMDEAI